MNTEDLRAELRSALEATDEQLRGWASRHGIALAEPSLEERHPRPWKSKLYYHVDGNDQVIPIGTLIKTAPAALAAWNREPLLLEIAEAAEEAVTAWLLGRHMASRRIDTPHDKLENLLHRLRLEQREEKS